MLRTSQLRRDGKRHGSARGLGQVEAGDLACGVGFSLPVLLSPGKTQIVQGSLLLHFTHRGLERSFPRPGQAFWEIPVAVGPQHQEAPAIVPMPDHNRARGEFTPFCHGKPSRPFQARLCGGKPKRLLRLPALSILPVDAIEVNRGLEAMFAIAVHGGAGDWGAGPEGPVLAGVEEAARAGAAILARGGSALDAVVEAVRLLEDNPLFNAGTGSALTAAGEAEMDASVMTGSRFACGGVACIRRVRNPVLVARRVLEEGRHVLLAGEGALAFARRCGFPDHDPVTPEQRQRWAHSSKEATAPGTVGAVALDQTGELAAATSTGGTFLKWPGRIGDSPIPGAGNYATPDAAVSATGRGELMLRLCAAKRVCDAVHAGRSAAEAVQEVLGEMAARLGTDAGFIAVDRNGRLGVGHLTRAMPHAVATRWRPEPVARMGA